MRVPTAYRKSTEHRLLWATMKFLAEKDTTCPVLKGEYDREVVKAAVDRRRTILEHETADKLRDYFQEERVQVTSAVKNGRGIDKAIDSLQDDLRETLTDSLFHTVKDWASWVAMPMLPRKKSAEQPRDERGRWAETMGAIRGALSPDLLHPKYRDAAAKSPDPHCAGHCYAASEALYHLGAKDAGYKPHSIRHEDSVHWYLKHPETGDVLDPTSSQFHKPVPYGKGVGRGFLTSKPSKRARTIMDRVRAVHKAEEKKPKPQPTGFALGTATDAWLARNMGKKITGITEASRKKIAEQILLGQDAGESLPQIAKRIDKFYLEDIIPNRAMVIARTEVGSALNWIQQAIAEDTDVPMEKEWLALDDSRTRDTHREADGQRVGVDDTFLVGDNELMFPGDPSGDPEEIINCRCTVLHHVVDEAPPFKSQTPPMSPYEFAKSVTGIENADVITSLAYMKGVFGEADDWVRSREILMKHVYQIRRAGPPDEPRDESGKWTEGGGSAAADFSNHPDNTSHMSEPQRKAIQQYEKELFARNVGARGGMGKERMVVIAPDGTRIMDKEGSQNQVKLDGSEVRAMKGGVGTHNHPANVTLSAQDVETAWVAGLTEIRAVGNDYTYSLKPKPGKDWPNRLVLHAMVKTHLDPLSRASAKKAEELFGAERNAIDRKDRDAVKVFNKKLIAWNLIENTAIQHEAWLKAAPLLSLDYTRTKNKKGVK